MKRGHRYRVRIMVDSFEWCESFDTKAFAHDWLGQMRERYRLGRLRSARQAPRCCAESLPLASPAAPRRLSWGRCTDVGDRRQPPARAYAQQVAHRGLVAAAKDIGRIGPGDECQAGPGVELITIGCQQQAPAAARLPGRGHQAALLDAGWRPYLCTVGAKHPQGACCSGHLQTKDLR